MQNALKFPLIPFNADELLDDCVTPLVIKLMKREKSTVHINIVISVVSDSMTDVNISNRNFGNRNTCLFPTYLY